MQRMTAQLTPATIAELRMLARAGGGTGNAALATGWDIPRIKRVCDAYQIELAEGIVDLQPLPAMPAPEEMILVPVRMSKILFNRLTEEARVLKSLPTLVAHDIIECAFLSGDLSSLRSADPGEDGIRVCISSVASEPQASRKPK